MKTFIKMSTSHETTHLSAVFEPLVCYECALPRLLPLQPFLLQASDGVGESVCVERVSGRELETVPEQQVDGESLHNTAVQHTTTTSNRPTGAYMHTIHNCIRNIIIISQFYM